METLFLKDDTNAQFTGWIDYLLFVELGFVPPVVVGPVVEPVLEG